MNWISVKEKLPERLTTVLIYVPTEESIYVATFCDWDDVCNDWHTFPQSRDSDNIKQNSVTHWAPLPEPPK